MEIGVGLDATLNLSLDEQALVSQEAAKLGYTSIWTPETTGMDSFQVCAHRWRATCDIVDGGLATGIAVSPVMYRTPMAFAMSGGTMSQLTGGRFIMGIGSGGAYRPKARQALGLPKFSAMALMRDYLSTVRSLVAGEQVNYEGEAVTLKGGRLAIRPAPETPTYLGALGPEMLRLAGEMADGACLNWCDASQISWSRERIAEGAARSGRNPAEIKVAEYIRVCVDDDEDKARLAYAQSTMGYALGAQIPTEREKQLSYRGHFERMGFSEELARLDDMRRDGASRDAVAEAFDPDLLKQVGYYGRADGAAAALKDLSQGLDFSIVRVVASRPGVEAVLETLRACQPKLVLG